MSHDARHDARRRRVRATQAGEHAARLGNALIGPQRLQQQVAREFAAAVRRLDGQRPDGDAGGGDVGRRPSHDEVAQHARCLLGDAARNLLAVELAVAPTVEV